MSYKPQRETCPLCTKVQFHYYHYYYHYYLFSKLPVGVLRKVSYKAITCAQCIVPLLLFFNLPKGIIHYFMWYEHSGTQI